MASEPKYRILIPDDGSILPKGIWPFSISNQHDGLMSPIFNDWQTAMDEAIKQGIGRKTSEADTYELDPGVQIKAVRDVE